MLCNSSNDLSAQRLYCVARNRKTGHKKLSAWCNGQEIAALSHFLSLSVDRLKGLWIKTNEITSNWLCSKMMERERDGKIVCLSLAFSLEIESNPNFCPSLSLAFSSLSLIGRQSITGWPDEHVRITDSQSLCAPHPRSSNSEMWHREKMVKKFDPTSVCPLLPPVCVCLQRHRKVREQRRTGK